MELFDTNTKMADLIHSNYLLLPVINRFDIKLGFQDQTIGELCQKKKIDINFFLAIINTFHVHDYFPERELRSFSSNLMIDYLRKTHLDFLKVKKQKIESILETLVDSSKSDDLKIIQTFYNKYKDDLVDHIKDEEENTFPYVLQLQEAFDNNTNPLPDSITKYSIRSFEKEHTNVDEKLFDLKNIVIKFLAPTYSQSACNDFLFELFQLERELTDHARIEDKILVPKVMAMETEVKNA